MSKEQPPKDDEGKKIIGFPASRTRVTPNINPQNSTPGDSFENVYEMEEERKRHEREVLSGIRGRSALKAKTPEETKEDVGAQQEVSNAPLVFAPKKAKSNGFLSKMSKHPVVKRLQEIGDTIDEGAEIVGRELGLDHIGIHFEGPEARKKREKSETDKRNEDREEQKRALQLIREIKDYQSFYAYRMGEAAMEGGRALEDFIKENRFAIENATELGGKRYQELYNSVRQALEKKEPLTDELQRVFQKITIEDIVLSNEMAISPEDEILWNNYACGESVPMQFLGALQKFITEVDEGFAGYEAPWRVRDEFLQMMGDGYHGKRWGGEEGEYGSINCRIETIEHIKANEEHLRKLIQEQKRDALVEWKSWHRGPNENDENRIRLRRYNGLNGKVNEGGDTINIYSPSGGWRHGTGQNKSTIRISDAQYRQNPERKESERRYKTSARIDKIQRGVRKATLAITAGIVAGSAALFGSAMVGGIKERISESHEKETSEMTYRAEHDEYPAPSVDTKRAEKWIQKYRVKEKIKEKGKFLEKVLLENGIDVRSMDIVFQSGVDIAAQNDQSLSNKMVIRMLFASDAPLVFSYYFGNPEGMVFEQDGNTREGTPIMRIAASYGEVMDDSRAYNGTHGMPFFRNGRGERIALNDSRLDDGFSYSKKPIYYSPFNYPYNGEVFGVVKDEDEDKIIESAFNKALEEIITEKIAKK